MNRTQTYQVPKGKTKNGIIPVPIIVNGTNTHNSGDVAKQGSVRANLLGIIPFAKKLFSKKKKTAPAPRKPLSEGELVISFYDSAKELLSTEILSLKSENEWETLSFSTKAEEKGFVSASIRGTSSAPVKFDDFSIQLKSLYSAKLYQENHYYPFGINMKGLESQDEQTIQNKDEHLWQYNSMTEREKSFDLFWDETPFRPMDMQLGRFWGVDLKAAKYVALTPFHYGFNNPVSLNDPTGLEAEVTQTRKEARQARRAGRRWKRFIKRLVGFKGWLEEQNTTITTLISQGNTTAAVDEIMKTIKKADSKIKGLKRHHDRVSKRGRHGTLTSRRGMKARTGSYTNLGLSYSGGIVETVKSRNTRGGTATTDNPINENVFFDQVTSIDGAPAILPNDAIVFAAMLFIDISVRGGSANIDISTANNMMSNGNVTKVASVFVNPNFSGRHTGLFDITGNAGGSRANASNFVSPSTLSGVSFSLKPNGSSVSSQYRYELSLSYFVPFGITSDVVYHRRRIDD